MAEVKFENFSVQVKGALEEAANIFLEEAASEIQSQTQRRTPVDTGQLKGSWAHTVDESAHEATIGSPLENAIWTEFGTGEYALEGNGRSGAWYVPVEKVTGRKKPTFNGKVTIVQGSNGQKFYKTNGKKPVRMLHNAFEENKAKIQRRADILFKEKLK